jgi:hypothetical protein
MLELSTYQHVDVPVRLSPDPEPKSHSDAVGVMLAKCFRHMSRFTAWEKEFLYSLNDQREKYDDWEATHKQRTSLLKIFAKLPREKANANDQA